MQARAGFRACAFAPTGLRIHCGWYVFACRGWRGCLRVGRSAGPDIALSACALLDPAHGAHDPAQCRLGQGLGHAQFAPTGLRIAAGMYAFACRGWRGCLRVVALLVWVAVECAWRARGTRALQASPAPYTATLAAARWTPDSRGATRRLGACSGRQRCSSRPGPPPRRAARASGGAMMGRRGRRPVDGAASKAAS